jgi:hypothetical protein
MLSVECFKPQRAASSEYVAPDGALIFVGAKFYKYIAPTVLEKTPGATPFMPPLQSTKAD